MMKSVLKVVRNPGSQVQDEFPCSLYSNSVYTLFNTGAAQKKAGLPE